MKKTEREIDHMLKDQDKLLDLVSRQNKKNARLEEHLAGGLGVDKLKKGQSARDPNYDPLDDLSSEEIDWNEETATGRGSKRGKRRGAGNAYAGVKAGWVKCCP